MKAQHYYRTASDFARAVTAASRCKDCGGASISQHQRQRSSCKEGVAKAERNGRKRKEDQHEEDQGEYTPRPSKRNRGS